MKIIANTVWINLFLCVTLHAQNLTGLWEIKKVTVGEEVMTPMAKWTRIHPDGTFESGNGWLQNAVGTWVFDEKTSRFSAVDKFGLRDEYGSFHVQFAEGKMIWDREEDGLMVVVILERIEKLPVSTADLLSGLWHLVEAKRDETVVTTDYDPENRYFVFFRWDRIYQERTSSGDRRTGYWHIHGHRPEVTFWGHDENKAPESWLVNVSDTTLKMHGISDNNQGLILDFRRIHQFPE